MKRNFDEELAKEYGVEGLTACPMLKAGQVFYADWEWHEPETHLIPNILKSIFNKNKNFKIYGDDYNTIDGTCIRDYVNVEDLAEAHKLAINYLNKENKSEIFNVGTEKGNSVKEVFDLCSEVTGEKIPVEICPRRFGDMEALYANASKIKKVLNWNPKRILRDSILTAYKWEQKLSDINIRR